MSKIIGMIAVALSIALAGCAGTMPEQSIEKGVGTSSAGSPS